MNIRSLPVAVEASPVAFPPPEAVGALILGGAHGSLAVVRSLGRKGVPVIFVTHDHPIARYSRYAGRTFSWRGPDHPEAESFLLGLAARLNLRGWLLLPGGDAEVRFVSQHRDVLATVFRVMTPAWEVTKRAHDKRLTYEHAALLGIAFPRSFYPRDEADVAAIDCPFPMILKPTVRNGRNRFTLAKAWRADSREQLLTLYREAASLVGTSSIVIQELVPGGGESQFSYAGLWQDGRPLASLTARRSRQYPIDFGYTSTFVETVAAPQIEAAATRFLASLGYSGLVELEFKHDARDGKDKLLDVNPRPWTWIGLGAAAGVALPWLLWCAAMGLPQPEPATARPGAAWLHTSRDLAAAIAGRLGIGAYVRSLRKPVTFAAFAADDPLPGLVELPLVAARVLTRRLPALIQGLFSRR